MGRPGKKAQRLNIANGSLFDTICTEQETQSASIGLSFDATRPEQSYCDLIPIEHRKRFAQFFTPEPIAQLMIDWVRAVKPESVLDPAVGPGVFLRLMARSDPRISLVGVEVDQTAIEAARLALKNTNAQLISHDFLTWGNDSKFDGIVANPPYLRHHDIHYSFDVFAEIGHRNGVILSKLANIYILFILEICRRLKPGGRAAVIVPGEWTNANFGMALKRYLLSNGYLDAVVYFSNLSEQFEDALTTAAILLIEKPASKVSKRDTFESYFVEHGEHFDGLRRIVLDNAKSVEGVIHRTFLYRDVVELEKWDKVLRDGMAEQRAGFGPLSTVASSRRGIATGANDFFHLSDADVVRLKLRRSNLKACVGRADDVRSLKFTKDDFEAIQVKQSRVWLLSFESVPNESEQEYIKAGVERGLDDRFLLAGRKPWYSMERRPPSPIWAAVFGRKSLRFVYNEAGVSNLTTFHCIYPERTDAIFCRALVACLNSRLVQELAEHQRRVYGGGLIKFEPKDLLQIQVPLLAQAPETVLCELSEMLDALDGAIRRSGEIPEEMVQALDAIVGRAGLGGQVFRSTPLTASAFNFSVPPTGLT